MHKKLSLTKKILGTLAIVGCSSIFLNGYVGLSEPTYAAGGTQTTETTNNEQASSLDTMGLWQILDILLKIIYILLRPLLIVAGLALDNTLVYASVFHLDVPLWKFWNMMKNFANFALGFMVLFAIIKSILTNSGEGSMKDTKTPLGIIKTTLIAGVLIQASRFLVAATVDISTIATYAVGGLPLSVLKNTDIGQQKILSVQSSIDLNKFDILSPEGENFKVRYATQYRDGNTIKDVQLSPCRMEEGYIIGRQYPDSKFRNSEIFGDGQSACVAFGKQIVIYNEFPNVADKDGSNYKTELNRILGIQDDRTPREACGYIIKVSGQTKNMESCITLVAPIYTNYLNDFNIANDTADDDMAPIINSLPLQVEFENIGIDAGTTRFNSDNVIATTITDLIEKSKGFVGPLVTIYASLLDFAQLTDTSITSVGETSGIFIIKTLVAVGLFFPLLALAVVLIMRVGLLWLYIVASPFIILKSTFKDFLKMEKLDKYLDIKSVMGIIFAPVITVAALSISLIFMTALVDGFSSTASRSDIQSSLGIQPIEPTNKDNYAMNMGNYQAEFTKLPRGAAMDRFSRLMVNFFAIGLMRMIVFAAIKANKLGESVGGKVQTFGENFFSTLPILPISEGGGRVGLGSMGAVINNAPDKYISRKQSEQRNLAEEWISGNKEGTTIPTSIDTQRASSLITANSTKESIQQGLKEKGVEEANMGTVLNSSYATLGAAVEKITDKQKQQNVIVAIGEAGAGAQWFETYTKDKTKTDLDALPAADEKEFRAIFIQPTEENMKKIDAYFKLAGDNGTYERIIGEDTYVVKKGTTNEPYIVEKKTKQSS